MFKIRSRIPIEFVKVNMIVSEDVVDYKGIILIPKDTIMTEKHIFKLEMYNILSVVIKDPEGAYADNSPEPPVVNAHNIPSIQQPASEDFKIFEEEYYAMQKKTKEILLNISNGQVIDTQELFEITNHIIHKSKSKSELLNHMYELREYDDYTYTHSINVSLLANIFAGWLGYPKEDIESLTISGLLHDIGKTKVDPSLLNKPGKLTDDEFAIIKHHSAFGYEMLRSQNVSNDIKAGVLMHHERMDGSGYPLGFKGNKIHEFGKILAICDIYDAMTSNRSYHQKFSPFIVIKMFEEESYGILSTEHLFIFLKNIAHNYIGRTVQLSNNVTGKIIFINPKHPSMPLIQTDSEIIDLSINTNLSITNLVSS